LVDVVAHEIAHSWMGNLVTTQNWAHFWLNEGFTVFIERKIAGRLHGNEVMNFDALIGLRALKESVDGYNESNHPEYSCLCPNLQGEDPDDVFSSVPYEKGFNLLFYLEQLVGGPTVFEPFVREYVKNFAHQSITTTDFKTFMYDYFTKFDGGSKIVFLNSVDWESWFHKPGMPIIENKFDKTLAFACESLAEKWDGSRATLTVASFPKSDYDAFNSNQKIMFFEKLLAKVLDFNQDAFRL
jgi:aminopeptidase N